MMHAALVILIANLRDAGDLMVERGLSMDQTDSMRKKDKYLGLPERSCTGSVGGRRSACYPL